MLVPHNLYSVAKPSPLFSQRSFHLIVLIGALFIVTRQTQYFDQLFVCCAIVYSDQLLVGSSYTVISYHDIIILDRFVWSFGAINNRMKYLSAFNLTYKSKM